MADHNGQHYLHEQAVATCHELVQGNIRATPQRLPGIGPMLVAVQKSGLLVRCGLDGPFYLTSVSHAHGSLMFDEPWQREDKTGTIAAAFEGLPGDAWRHQDGPPTARTE